MTARDNDGGAAKPGGPIRIPGREADSKPLPRRFYKHVAVAPAASGQGYAILLDGRPARTPGRRELTPSTQALATALANEWEAQDKQIDPSRMPFTRLVNTALDGVSDRMADVAADIVRYAGSDLLCYRADFPEGLVRRQADLWDPVVTWSEQRHGAAFRVTSGIVHVAQPPEVAERLSAVIAPLDAFRLTALHVMTTLMGSALLALAVLDKRLPPEAAWQAAHVDEDWQIAEWGADDEATARRAKRWQEMQAAAAMLTLLGDA